MKLVRLLALPMVVLVVAIQWARGEEPKIHEVPKEGLVIQGMLNKDDPPVVAGFKGEPHQVFRVQLKKDVSYVVDVVSNAFDAYLIVMDAKGKTVAEDDDGGEDLNARVQLLPKDTEAYQIIVKSLDKDIGAFEVRISKSVEWAEAVKVAEEKEDYEAALHALRNALDVAVREFGAEHWKTTDVRLSLRHVGLLKHMDANSKLKLREARDLYARESIDAAKSAVVLFRQVFGENHPETAHAINRVGFLLDLAQRHDEAQIVTKQAVPVFEAVFGNRHPHTARPFHNLGFSLEAQGKYKEALSYYEKALAIRIHAHGEFHQDASITLNNMGDVLMTLAEFSAARHHFERSLRICETLLGKNHPATAYSLSSLGSVCHHLSEYSAAKAFYLQALAIRTKRLGETSAGTANSLNNLGVLETDQGAYYEARLYLAKALEIRERLFGPKHRDTATSLNNLGRLYSIQGDLANARVLYERALGIFEETLGESHPKTASMQRNVGALAIKQFDYVAAKRHFQSALKVHKDQFGENHPEIARSLDLLAHVLDHLGEDVAARQHLAEAIAIREKALGEYHPDTATSIENLGSLLMEHGELQAAKGYLQRSLAINRKTLGEEHPYVAISLSNLALLMRNEGDHVKARPLHEQALAIQRRSLDLSAWALAERQQFAMNQQLRLYLDAYLSQSAAAKVAASEDYSHVLAWKGAVSLRQRQLRLVRQTPELAALATELQAVCTRLANLSHPSQFEEYRKQLNDLTLRKEAIEVELSQKSASFRQVQDSVAADPNALRAALPKDTALVDFLVYMHAQPDPDNKGKWIREQRLAAFVVRKDEAIVRVDLGPVPEVAEQIDVWLERARAKHPLQGVRNKGAKHPGMELRRLIWLPLEKHLQNVRSVLISPDGPLTMLPFAALPGTDPSKFLLEERMIATLPLPRLLPEMSDQSNGKASPEPSSLLLLGDVDFGASIDLAQASDSRSAPRGPGLGWKSLKETAGELDAVKQYFSKQFPKGSVKELTKANATESAIRHQSGNYRWLHFATHGYFSPPEVMSATAPVKPSQGPVDLFGQGNVNGFHPGLLSGVVLAGANQTPEPGRDDGILTALEVAELNLQKANLVVLSACETGLGKVAGGEGVLGLQRAFQLAGAESVVSSLWKVDDAGTRKLMEKFYENLWQHRLPTGEALRQAQLWMMREGPSLNFVSESDAGRDLAPPYYWAAFVLSGNWR